MKHNNKRMVAKQNVSTTTDTCYEENRKLVRVPPSIWKGWTRLDLLTKDGPSLLLSLAAVLCSTPHNCKNNAVTRRRHHTEAQHRDTPTYTYKHVKKYLNHVVQVEYVFSTISCCFFFTKRRFPIFRCRPGPIFGSIRPTSNISMSTRPYYKVDPV